MGLLSHRAAGLCCPAEPAPPNQSPHTPLYTHPPTHDSPPPHTQQAATGPITMIADLQGSLLGRFRTRTADRPVVQAPPASSPPPKPPSGGGSGSKTDLVEDLNDVGQHLSRFTAAVLEEEKGGSGLAGVTTSGRGIQGSTLKGLPSDFLTRPLAADEATVRGASAVVRVLYFFGYGCGGAMLWMYGLTERRNGRFGLVRGCVCAHTPSRCPATTKTNMYHHHQIHKVGGVVGLALGGPLLALVGAAWTSYSCTQPSSDAGAAARGTGQWAVGLYNFMAKVGSVDFPAGFMGAEERGCVFGALSAVADPFAR